jgi:hypothetical protein
MLKHEIELRKKIHEIELRKRIMETRMMHPMSPFPDSVFGVERPPTSFEMLAMRMRWIGGSSHPFESVITHVVGDKAFVWIITKDKFDSVVLEDDAAMYPSDTLITQIRLLENTP